MMKKTYHTPKTKYTDMESEEMLADSHLNPVTGTQEVTPSTDPWNGEFGAKEQRSVWDE